MSAATLTRAQRDARIIRYVTAYGWTYQRAADRFGVTRQRAWQIVTKHEGPRPFWCDAERGSKLCLRRYGHDGQHKWGARQIVTKAGKA